MLQSLKLAKRSLNNECCVPSSTVTNAPLAIPPIFRSTDFVTHRTGKVYVVGGYFQTVQKHRRLANFHSRRQRRAVGRAQVEISREIWLPE